MMDKQRPTHLYILKCRDGSFYVGITGDLDRRLANHQAGRGPGHTWRRRPVKLVFSRLFADRKTAAYYERLIKGWSRARKEALVSGELEFEFTIR